VTTRARALQADCPKCGAGPGSPCTGVRGARKSPHRVRFGAPVSKAKPRPKPKPTPASFYETDEWRRLRYRALKQHGAKCQCCGTGGRIHVDHIKPRSRFPELELELTNLQVLCADCNLGKGAWDQTDWRAS
jgi:hypothetical protein